jgi:hypothetical protein
MTEKKDLFRALRFEKKRYHALLSAHPTAKPVLRTFGKEDVSHVSRALVKSTLMPAVCAIFTLVYFEKNHRMNLNFRVISADEAEVFHDDCKKRHTRNELIDMLFLRVAKIGVDIGIEIVDEEKRAIDDLLLYGATWLTGGSTHPSGSLRGEEFCLVFCPGTVG